MLRDLSEKCTNAHVVSTNTTTYRKWFMFMEKCGVGDSYHGCHPFSSFLCSKNAGWFPFPAQSQAGDILQNHASQGQFRFFVVILE